MWPDEGCHGDLSVLFQLAAVVMSLDRAGQPQTVSHHGYGSGFGPRQRHVVRRCSEDEAHPVSGSLLMCKAVSVSQPLGGGTLR